MKITKSLKRLYRGRKRGVALAMALMATVLLMILAVSFSMLSIEHARSSSDKSDSEMVKSLAEWGIESTIICMGIPANWSPNAGFDDGINTFAQFSPSVAFGATSSNVLVSPALAGFAALAGDGTIAAQIDTPSLTETNINFRSNGTNYTHVLPPMGAGLGTPMVSRVRVDVVRRNTENLAKRQYDVTSTAELFMAPAGGGNIAANTEPLATRVVRAVVVETTEENNSHYLENARVWKPIGVADADLRANVLIPENYVENGKMTITGTRFDTDLQAGTAGNLAFLDPESGNVQFNEVVSIFRDTNLRYNPATGGFDAYGDQTVFQGGSGGSGGLLTGEPYASQPNQDKLFTVDHDGDGSIRESSDPNHYLDPSEDERGTFKILTEDRVNTSKNGFIEIDTDFIKKVHKANADAGRHWSRDRDGDGANDVPPELANYNPPIPEVEIILGKNSSGEDVAKVYVWNPLEGDSGITTGSAGNLLENSEAGTPPTSAVGSPSGAGGNGTYQEVLISDLNNGTIYVEGGNVSVRSELDSSGNPIEIDSQVTVAVGEHPSRRSDVAPSEKSLYHPAADMMRYTAQASTALSQELPGASVAFNSPPYSLGDIQNPMLADPNPANPSVDMVAALEATRTALDTMGGGASFLNPDNTLNEAAVDAASGGNEVMRETIKMMAVGEARFGKKMTPTEVREMVQQTLDGVQEARDGKYGSDVNQPFWQPPPESINREGNLNIVGDVRKSDNGRSVIGLVAENHILLNDRTRLTKRAHGGAEAEKALSVDAVLRSINESVQFDWSNASNNRVIDPDRNEWLRMAPMFLDPNDPNAAFNGTFNFNGSIIGKFVDVQGDSLGRGYTVQNMAHDSTLENYAPPGMPRNEVVAKYDKLGNPDRSNADPTMTWMLQSMEDLGSSTTVD